MPQHPSDAINTTWTNSDSDLDNTKADTQWVCGEQPAPWPDNTFDYIHTEHALEHVNNIHNCLAEMWRISKKDAVWHIILPHANSYQDNLFHPQQGFHRGSFNKFFGSTTRGYGQYIKLEKVETWNQAVGIKRLIPFKFILGYFLNNIWYEVHYKLKVIKP